MKSFDNYSYLLCSQGFQGVVALSEMLSIGINLDSISIITFESPFNSVLIEFLKFNKKSYFCVKSSGEVDKYLENKEFDILLSMGFRYIFSPSALKKVKLASINFHPGLLPKYKGSFSTAWSIINNEKNVGYTYHFISRKIDGGNIIMKKKILINPYDTAQSLHYKIWNKGISKLPLVLQNVIKQIDGYPQRNVGKYYKNELPFSGLIDEGWDDSMIERFIRAMYFPPFEPAKLIKRGVEHLVSSIEEYIEIIKNDK